MECSNIVQGSIEAVRQALEVLPQDNVTLKFLLEAPGDVNTSDVDLAFASKAIIFGFNVKASGSVKSYADNKGVEIRPYRVIYDLIDDVRNAMEGLLESIEVNLPDGTLPICFSLFQHISMGSVAKHNRIGTFKSMRRK